jgi:hypothetical protein
MDMFEAPRWCCRKMEFRTIVKQERAEGDHGPTVSTETRCVVCFNRHYTLEVPPVHFGVTGAHIG